VARRLSLHVGRFRARPQWDRLRAGLPDQGWAIDVGGGEEFVSVMLEMSCRQRPPLGVGVVVVDSSSRRPRVKQTEGFDLYLGNAPQVELIPQP
jgi:hypothetical protein